MKPMKSKNEFVELFLKQRYEEYLVKFNKDPKNKGKTSSFGTTQEGKKQLMQHALAMYQLYLGTAGLPETPIPVDAPARSDSQEYSVFEYIKNRVQNTTLLNILINNIDSIDIQECITPEFELAVINFGQVINLEKEHGSHTGIRSEYCTQALINYFNFFKNNGTASQFIEAVVVIMTQKANLTLSPSKTPTDIFSQYVNIVRANIS